MAQGQAEDARERERVAARIRALLAKTVENGCTEQEALSAAAMAADMLGRHGIDLDEVEMRASPFAQPSSDHAGDVAERLLRVAAAIEALTGARHWRVALRGGGYRYEFLGFAHEAEIAGYLLEICARAMQCESDRAAKGYVLYRPEVRRRRLAGFLDGMADSLRARILAMRPPRPKGTGIVPLRGALIDEEMVRRGLKEPTGARNRLNRDFEDSYAPGMAAGERVALDPGLKPPKPSAGKLAAGSA